MFKNRNETFYQETLGRATPLSTANTWERSLPFWKSNYEVLCRGDFDTQVRLWRQRHQLSQKCYTDGARLLGVLLTSRLQLVVSEKQ